MKKNIVKIFALSFFLLLGIGSSLSAQNFHSKPQAVKNLADEAKYLASTLPQLEENDETMFKVNKEKLRFVQSMLTGLKSEASTVANVAESVLPKEELHVIQPSVRFIDTSFANMNRQKYIRTQILFLISY